MKAVLLPIGWPNVAHSQAGVRHSRPYLKLLVLKGGVPERTRTSDFQLRKLTLYPLSYGHPFVTSASGGEGGIRTLGRGLPPSTV